MITREELLKSPEYWITEVQMELYRNVLAYMEKEGLNQTQLAQQLEVSKGYVSQVLNGNFNYTLRKLIELSLAVGKVPVIEFKNIDAVIAQDRMAAVEGAVEVSLHEGLQTTYELSEPRFRIAATSAGTTIEEGDTALFLNTSCSLDEAIAS